MSTEALLISDSIYIVKLPHPCDKKSIRKCINYCCVGNISRNNEYFVTYIQHSDDENEYIKSLCNISISANLLICRKKVDTTSQDDNEELFIIDPIITVSELAIVLASYRDELSEHQ